MIQKNEEYIVDIIDMGYEGEGIAKIEGYTLFVKGAITGEKVKVKVLKANKDFGFAKLLEVIEKSPKRVEPVCPVFEKCGGCELQHLDYDAQLEHKTNMVKNTLRKSLGYEVNVEDAIGMCIPYNYRNKTQYPVMNDKIGFYASRTHAIIENEGCYIQNKYSDKLAKSTFEILKKNGNTTYNEETKKGNLRHIVTRVGANTDEVMLMIITKENKIKNSENFVKEVVDKYPEVTTIVQNINEKDGNVILGKKCVVLHGNGYIEDSIEGIRFKISPLSFYQVNPTQTAQLYSVAKEYAELTGEENVFDLYCGIGTIGLFVADKAKSVYGVEIVPEAIEDAKENAKLNGITNAEFICGKAEEVIPQKYAEGKTADVVFVDPPRKGCDEKLLETLKEMQAKKIVYVSCNPATLARDLKYLTDNRYEVKKVQPVDMFPHTSHVESVTLLSCII
ncbi:MAG: 23S rRNA (uracil(1939)-C(5))-methyltransferase RlmD [Clostridia bacterium]|nr:23S rRNA (uracil(1939)-C(5))-methyltransferase RlmD [Clostridia bacterium]